MERGTLALSALIRDSRVQSREAINVSVVREYAEAMAKLPVYAEAGLAVRPFPPVTVFSEATDGVTYYWLADGWHRVLAAEMAGYTTVDAEIHPGGIYDAIMHAAGANAAHGLRRSTRDKQRAVMMLLEHPEVIAGQWSTGRIAHQAGVSTPMVKAARERREAELGLPQQRERLGRDGKLYALQRRNDENPAKQLKDGRRAVEDGEAVDHPSDASRALIHECGTPGCSMLTTEPSWHCGGCSVHWPLDYYPPGTCPSCDDQEGDRNLCAAEVVGEVSDAELPQAERSGERQTQAPYTPGILKADAPLREYERLLAALDILESLRNSPQAPLGEIMACVQDGETILRLIATAREVLNECSAATRVRVRS